MGDTGLSVAERRPRWRRNPHRARTGRVSYPPELDEVITKRLAAVFGHPVVGIGSDRFTGVDVAFEPFGPPNQLELAFGAPQ
jgi:hypothetical protein